MLEPLAYSFGFPRYLERPLVSADPGVIESTKTVILGAQIFLGQYVNDWNAVLASLTLAVVPVVLLYIVFSRQLIQGLTSGSVK